MGSQEPKPKRDEEFSWSDIEWGMDGVLGWLIVIGFVGFLFAVLVVGNPLVMCERGAPPRDETDLERLERQVDDLQDAVEDLQFEQETKGSN